MPKKRIILFLSTVEVPQPLQKVLSRASKHPKASYEGGIRSAFHGLESYPIPYGALHSFALGFSEEAIWCKAELINCQVDHKSATIISAYEGAKQPFHQQLNQLTSEDGVQFHLTDNNEWLCRISNHTRVQMQDLSISMGQCMSQCLPQGEDSPYWNRLLTESQMLFSHNLSLWFWAIGKLPQNIQTDYDAVYSNDLAVLGLAKCANVKHAAIPTDIDSLLDSEITFILNNGEKYLFTKRHLYYFWRKRSFTLDMINEE